MNCSVLANDERVDDRQPLPFWMNDHRVQLDLVEILQCVGG
jgi:hypothetical protein